MSTNTILNKRIDIKVFQRFMARASRFPLASLNYHLGNYKDPIWLVGDGRSGSTWLSDLINWDRRYRELFEPFHPYIVNRVKDYHLFQYMRQDEIDSDLGDFLRSIFSGEFKHFRTDVSQIRLFYEGLIVKDIFAHHLIPWVHANIPHVKKILIIRNPFAVALSKQKLAKKWIWMTEPKDFFKQHNLCDDYLNPFEDVIQSIDDNDFIEKQVLIWAIIHYVPLSALNEKDIYIIFYEDLVSNPLKELEKLFSFLGIEYLLEDKNLLKRIHVPTRTTKDFHKGSPNKSAVSSWKNELSTKQISQGLQIIERFQLSNIYKDE